MAVRLTVAAICFTIAMAACAMANIYVGRMVKAINDRSTDERISPIGWHPAKSAQVRSDYRRLYPDGSLRRQARNALIVMFISMLGVAVAIGIIPIFGQIS